MQVVINEKNESNKTKIYYFEFVKTAHQAIDITDMHKYKYSHTICLYNLGLLGMQRYFEQAYAI